MPGQDDLSGIGKEAYISVLLSDGFINMYELSQYKKSTPLYSYPADYNGYLNIDGTEIKDVYLYDY